MSGHGDSAPGTRLARLALGVAVTGLALMLAARVAHAAPPVTNGPIVFESLEPGRPAIGIANADGSHLRPALIAAAPADRDPALSRDGTRIAFTSLRDGNEEIYVAGVDGSGQRNLTQSPARDHDAAWGPGDQVAFASDRAGGEHIFITAAAGGGVSQLTSGGGIDQQPSWSPDGGHVVFASDRGGGGLDLYVADVATGATRDITPDPEPEADPSWGPTGAIAFTRGAFGAQEIYRIDQDGTNLTQLTHDAGADHFPTWSPDGTEIAYGALFGIGVMSASEGDRVRPLGFAPIPGGLDGNWGPAPAAAPTATPDAGANLSVAGSASAVARVRPGAATADGTLPARLRSDISVVPPKVGVDVREGAVTVTASTPQSGTDVTTVQLRGGRFGVSQSRAGGAPIIRFAGPPPPPCGAARAAGRHRHQSAHITGKGKAKPHYGSALPPGTTWTVTETCAGTRYSVQQGRLVVHYKGRTHTVTAGHPYLARR